MTRVRTVGLALVAAVLIGVLVGPAALAQDDGGGDAKDEIVFTGRLRVPEGETVATAVIFNGPALIEGTVTETLVVFNGATVVAGTIEGDVVVFNGTLAIRAGAHVGGDVFSRRTPQIDSGATVDGDVKGIAGRFDFRDLWFVGRFAWWIGYTISTLILGLFLLGFAPRLDGAIAEAVDRRFGASAGLGAAGFFLLPIAAALLLVLVVSIPLGVFLLLAFALIYTIGYVVGAHAIGRMLVKKPTSRFLALLAGLGILRLIALIPFVGGLIWALASILGLGVLIVAARGRRPVETPAAVPPPPAPAAPALP
jgi:hypothetical protein